MIQPPQKALLIFVDETDLWREEPLYAAIVKMIQKQGLAGATVMSGLMGFGIHGRIHRKGLFGVSDDRPVTIISVDNEAKLRAALPAIAAMVREGLVLLLDAEVISTGTASGTET